MNPPGVSSPRGDRAQYASRGPARVGSGERREPPRAEPDFFFRNDGDRERDVPRSSLLTDEALENACRWKDEKLNSSQLRRFFHEVKGILAPANAAESDDGFRRVQPRLALLRSKAAYACPPDPGSRRIPRSFRDYLEKMAVNVRDVHDLRAFALAFEASVGYFYGEGGADKGGRR